VPDADNAFAAEAAGTAVIVMRDALRNAIRDAVRIMARETKTAAFSSAGGGQ
jgi:hypothetical protein